MNEDPSSNEHDPEIELINRTTVDILEKSDRIRAVLLGTQIDDLLQRLIEAFLIPKQGKKDRLLEGSGFASTFSARIELAFRIGLIPPIWYQDLKIINEIRDAFAHGLAGLTLNEPNLNKLCFDLKSVYGKFKGSSELKALKDNPQTRFIGTTIVMSSRLLLARRKIEQIPETWRTLKTDAVRLNDPDFESPALSA